MQINYFTTKLWVSLQYVKPDVTKHFGNEWKTICPYSVCEKESFHSQKSDTTILQSIYLAYYVGVITSQVIKSFKNTIELPYNVASCDWRKSVIIDEQSIKLNCNKLFLNWFLIQCQSLAKVKSFLWLGLLLIYSIMVSCILWKKIGFILSLFLKIVVNIVFGISKSFACFATFVTFSQYQAKCWCHTFSIMLCCFFCSTIWALCHQNYWSNSL